MSGNNYLKGKQDELEMWREAENSIIALEASGHPSRASGILAEGFFPRWRAIFFYGRPNLTKALAARGWGRLEDGMVW
jgi:hypothetical protein